MKNLGNLFKLIQLTRSQIQQGYLLAGIPTDKISNLAEHHYLVTFIAWQLAINLKQAGAKVDVQKVMEFCLIHDVGEILGGDISAPYARMNPKARKFAKAYEEENHKYLGKFFGSNEKYFRALAKEIMDAKSDEALIAKAADYIESTCFLVFTGNFNKSRKEFQQEIIGGFIRKIKDKIAKKYLQEFLTNWLKDVERNDYLDILKLYKK